MRHYTYLLLLVLLQTGLVATQANASVVYVKYNATGLNNGSSWTNAYTDLQAALDNTSATEIWVAAGTYYPKQRPDGTASTATDRDNAFHLARNVSIYGGFAGTETMLSQRNWLTNVTVLSGDFDADDAIYDSGELLSMGNNSENAYHVFITKSLTSACIIDGFTFRGGGGTSSISITGFMSYSSGSFFRNRGGGLYNINSSPTVSNCIFIGNDAEEGAGIYNFFSSPVISNSSFLLNYALSGAGMYNWTSHVIANHLTFEGNFGYNTGGGMYNNSSIPQLTGLMFTGNAAGTSGGGIYNFSSNPTIQNAIFNGNISNAGGAIFNSNSPARIINSTFVANMGYIGGAIRSEGTVSANNRVTIFNSIFRDNTQDGSNNAAGADISENNTGLTLVSNNIVQHITFQINNSINADPLFLNAANRNFRLRACSPAINAGINNYNSINALSTDFLGLLRVGVPDMGAYEYQGTLSPSVIYVKSNATGSNDGSSWANAFTDLQVAMDAQCGNFDIWVAAGTYKPIQAPDGNTSTGPTDRNNAFHLFRNMKIYGGFAGTETQLSQRNWNANKTILSGDFNGDDVVTSGGATLTFSNNTENAYHVFITANLTNAALIDGFNFKGGNANGSGQTLSIFYRNSGGGMYNYLCSPSITNSTFSNNSAIAGGGMWNDYGSPNITNSTFSNNSALYKGGGMYNNSGFLKIINSTFSNNSALYIGGGMYTIASYPHIINSIFWDNKIAGSNIFSGADIANDIGTPEVAYCLTQANSVYSTGTGIINNQDPLFVDVANGDFRLKSCSPAINTGTNLGAPITDILGLPRVGLPDMGAYEYQGIPFSSAIYVKSNATGSNDGSSWANAFTDIQSAMDAQCGNFDIWVAAGTYKPIQAPDGTTSTGPTDRNNAFHLARDMKIYGGFAGTETQLSQRNWTANKTILSGDFNGNDVVTGGGATLTFSNNTENAIHVFITANLTNAALIDGFVFSGGNANEYDKIIFNGLEFYGESGGGMFNAYSSPTITNSTFTNNYATFFGGGIRNISSSPTITNSTFSNNSSTQSGGGMFNTDSSPTISNSTFSNNSASFSGGGMFNTNFSSTISNSTFSNNSATFGGGLFNNSSSPTIINSTFSNNSSTESGGGMLNAEYSSPTIKNSIFWDNTKGGSNNVSAADIENNFADSHPSSPVVSFCLTQVYNTGANLLIGQDPQFVNASNGLLQLKCNSPAINAGTATGAPANDIAGFFRTGNPDLGAYEYGHAEVINALPNASNPSLSGIPVLTASSQILNTNNVLYQGINNVQLLPGFSVAPAPGQATVFRAEIGGGCF